MVSFSHERLVVRSLLLKAPRTSQGADQISKCDACRRSGAATTVSLYLLEHSEDTDCCCSWWTMVSLDAQVALASGLPPMVESKLYDVNPIDEADEV